MPGFYHTGYFINYYSPMGNKINHTRPPPHIMMHIMIEERRDKIYNRNIRPRIVITAVYES